MKDPEKIQNGEGDVLGIPAFFELDGQYAALLPLSDGGLTYLKDPDSPDIADFLDTGRVITQGELVGPVAEGVREELGMPEKETDDYTWADFKAEAEALGWVVASQDSSQLLEAPSNQQTEAASKMEVTFHSKKDSHKKN